MSAADDPPVTGSRSDGDADASDAADLPESRALPSVGALLTVVVAGQHLLHPEKGMLELFAVLNANPAFLLFDPRPLAFTASGVALFVGLSLSRNAPDRRPYYLAGIAVAAVYLVGYFAWHFTGHGGFLPGREPLFHGLPPLENVVSHLTTDVWAATTKAGEVALIIVLSLLYRAE
ncbi:hypothetical protein [Halobellus sp. EA9]|uniref:hypothetical protein n=1 Tax=Halobellus sp. EA9 TaxID=3421647 RepID=UPI003EBFA383